AVGDLVARQLEADLRMGRGLKGLVHVLVEARLLGLEPGHRNDALERRDAAGADEALDRLATLRVGGPRGRVLLELHRQRGRLTLPFMERRLALDPQLA